MMEQASYTVLAIIDHSNGNGCENQLYGKDQQGRYAYRCNKPVVKSFSYRHVNEAGHPVGNMYAMCVCSGCFTNLVDVVPA